MGNSFSVLMSLYFKEKAENLEAALNSILEQTILPNEIVIVIDGPITEELNMCLDYYKNKVHKLFKIIQLEENQGLGKALAEGILHCSNELIARMDTDDISRVDRFEKQLSEFKKNPCLDICGSYISEFETDPKVIKCVRKVPLKNEEIKRYHKKRDGFNHVSVMFKKSTVIKAGNYQHALLMEDSLLWANMFLVGATGMNINESLVYVRAGRDMIERRGGISYFLKYRIGRKKILETGYINQFEYLESLVIQFIVALVPNRLRSIIFTKLLRD